MRPFHEHSELVTFGIEFAINVRIFDVRFVAVRFGHHIVGIEWGYA